MRRTNCSATPRRSTLDQSQRTLPLRTRAKAHQIELLEHYFETSKYDIFTNGQIESQKPFIISNRIGRLRYESQSEADLGFATILAVHFDGATEKIDAAMRQSQLMRPKMGRTDYRENTIAKAIASAQKIKAPTYEATPWSLRSLRHRAHQR